jgi:integrase
MLTDQEAQCLIETAHRSQRVFRKLTGEDRAIMYVLAQRTGLRRKELKSLCPKSFDFDCVPPTVSLKAVNSKRRKGDVLPLPADVAELFRSYLDGRDSGEPIWPGSWWRRSAEMLRVDLADAGIESVSEDGLVVDFHGQRTTFITGLARAGVSPATAQELARHSDINLTLGTYTRLTADELKVAVEKLPALRPTGALESEPQANALGDSTDDAGLATIIAAWPALSTPMRAAILTIVNAAEKERW